MTKPYPPKNFIDQWRIELREAQESLEFWSRPGAITGAINMGPVIRDGTAAHVEELKAEIARLETLIREGEAVEDRDDVNVRAKSIVERVTGG